MALDCGHLLLFDGGERDILISRVKNVCVEGLIYGCGLGVETKSRKPCVILCSVII